MPDDTDHVLTEYADWKASSDKMCIMAYLFSKRNGCLPRVRQCRCIVQAHQATAEVVIVVQKLFVVPCAILIGTCESNFPDDKQGAGLQQ